MQTTIKPILKYPGAKWSSATWIAGNLPTGCNHYLEPYCGSAAIYFALPKRPRHAVLNDISNDIVNLLSVIRECGDELAYRISLTPWSRAEYHLSYEQISDPLERARRFLVRTWQANSADLSACVGWRNCGKVDAGSSPVPQWRKLPVNIVLAADALLHAEIDNRPAIDVIGRYASPDVLIYCDPPYPLSTRHGKLYQHEMTDADHAALLDALDAHPGPVVLSGYHCALYDDRLGHWTAKEKRVQAEKGNTRTEVLWLNPVCVERLGYGPLFEEQPE